MDPVIDGVEQIQRLTGLEEVAFGFIFGGQSLHLFDQSNGLRIVKKFSRIHPSGLHTNEILQRQHGLLFSNVLSHSVPRPRPVREDFGFGERSILVVLLQGERQRWIGRSKVSWRLLQQSQAAIRIAGQGFIPHLLRPTRFRAIHRGGILRRGHFPMIRQ